MGHLPRFLKRGLLFLISLPFVWFAFVVIWGTVIPEKFRNNLIYSTGQGFMNLRLEEAELIEKIDVLIVGSSHAYRGIDPRRLIDKGIHAFNLGSSLQTPVQTQLLLRKYLRQMNPKLVVFEVGYKTFSSDGVEGAIDLMVNSPDLNWDIVRMAIELNDMTVYNSLAYTFFRKSILNETRQEYLASHSDVDRYVPGGFVERKFLDYEGPTEFKDHVQPVNPLQQICFEETLRYLRTHNVKTILVQTPILYGYYTSIQNIHEYDDYFRRVASVDGYYNFSDSVYEETTYFYDHHHLNTTGVERFNDDLINVLRPHLDPLTKHGERVTPPFAHPRDSRVALDDRQ